MLPLLLIAALIGTSLAVSVPVPLGKVPKSPTVVDGAYIVQLKADSSLKARSSHDHTAHNAFRRRALALEINYGVRREFTNPKLFYGMSIDVQGNDTVAAVQARLNAIEGVEAVFPVVEYTRISPQRRARKSISSDPPSLTTPELPVLEPRAGCSSNNCLRELRKFSASAAPFCATYTTSINPDPSAIPSYLENCSGSPSKVSSACSCLVTATPTASGSTATVSTVSTPVSTSSDSTSTSTSVSTSASSTSRSSISTSASPTDSLTPPKVTGTSDVLSALKMSGIDKLHALGIKGNGMKIGIIDTGVDYRHPSLGGGFGPGFKVAGGHAYRDDAGNAVSSADPLTTCLAGGHGTHVTGIIGMEDPEDIGFGLVGVAPEAEIYMYRVFGCDDNAQSDDIISALVQAHADGVDVVSLSLGSVDYWQTADPFRITTSGLVAEGVAVIAAAGNAGTSGLFVPSSPGIGADVISVGSIENTEFPTVYQAQDSEGLDLSYASVWPLTSSASGLDIYVLGETATGCYESEWIAAGQAITKVSETIIVFHNDDTCDFADKEAFWAEYGFKYIMDYSTPGTNPYSEQYILLEQSDGSTIYSNLLPEDGVTIVANYAKAGGYPKYQISFTDNTVTSTKMATGGKTSYYSSFGPSWDYNLALKPQLSAPGGQILSTWPLGFNSGYAVLRGTSMATPFVSASYALIKSQFPNFSVQQIRELLQSFSSPVSSAYYPDLLATAVQQGAGLIDVYSAIVHSASVSPSQFEIGDTDNYLGKQYNFTITNNAPVTLTFKLTHDGAAMMEYSPFGVHPFVVEDPLWETQPEFAVYAGIEFTEDSISIPAYETGTVFFTVSPPADIDEGKVPVISGFITATSNGGEVFTLPYAGLPYSRYSAQYIDLSNHTLSETVSTAWPTVVKYYHDYDNFTYYNGSGIMVIDVKEIIHGDNSLDVGPLINCLQPTANLRVELLAANTTFKPTYYGYDTTVKWDYVLTTEAYRNVMEDKVTPTYGVIGGVNAYMPLDAFIGWFELTVRSPDDEWEDSGGVAPTRSGDYRMLISALRWGGTLTNMSDWESWLGPIIRVKDCSLPNCALPLGTPA